MAMEEKSIENIVQTIQDIDKTILKITEAIQVLRNAENKLNLVRYTFIDFMINLNYARLRGEMAKYK